MKTLITLLLLLLPIQAAPCSHGSLTKLTHGLTFTTSLEKPVRSFVYQGKRARDFMRRVKALDNNPCQPSRTWDEEVDWLLDLYCDGRCEGDGWNEAMQRRLNKVVAYMQANLTDLQTAFFGEDPAYEVYVFGRDRCGHIVGIRMVEVT